MKKSRLKRPSADETRSKILKASRRQFLKHGFDGATIGSIAKEAKVHTNLIFHHFLNKESLWLSVKELILADCPMPNYEQASARDFFKSILDYRFEVYTQNPDIVRLIQWQQLTESEVLLIGNKPYSPNDWLPIIKKFQKSGQIVKTFSAESMMLFIIFSTHAPFMQKVVFFDAAEKEKYKLMLLQMCEQTFLGKKQ